MVSRRRGSGEGGLGRRALLARLGGLAALSLLGPPLGASHPSRAEEGVGPIRLRPVAGREGRFLGWPANHGAWSWEGGRELLVGFAEGPWVDRPDSHKIGSPQRARLARSLDGGLHWSVEDPEGYVGGQGDRGNPRPTPAPIPFRHPDLALRVADAASSAPEHRLGRFFASLDRGRSWQGPFAFAGLENAPELEGLELTSRTCTVGLGTTSALFLLSAMDRRLGSLAHRLDKTFVARTDDGGCNFRFVSWVVPWSDPYRAVMPSLARLGPRELVVALRRRDPRGTEEANWVDLYASGDGGLSWRLRSRVGDCGGHNGNPPALTLLRDGRLACVYGNRSRREMVLRISQDGGATWGEEWRIRPVPFSQDLGYPRLLQNHRGELVAIYYLATEHDPYSHIEAALLRA